MRPSLDAETQLQTLLAANDLRPRPAYRVGEVAAILSIDRTTVRKYCALVSPNDPRTIPAYLVGTHYRIPHAGLLTWLDRNKKS